MLRARPVIRVSAGILVGALAVGCVVAALGCQRREATKPERTLLWQTVGAWSGRGNIQTESFPSDGVIRVRWKTSDITPPGPGVFRVTIHSAISGRPLATVVDHEGLGGDIAYVGEDPRVFYAEVESSGLTWSFSIEDATQAVVDRDSVRTPSPSIPKPAPR
jgi:hypothetical protein